ncbi:NADH-ubiquinone oxidoreductase chain 5 [Trachymyrmex cornetzi]|uniref:NADH:ubiquinone reductase (H(+)-translocating) n=1 Tax=Trachymyrmex cornetzi TaxID=471704 RepID=A0A151JC10_9HYME|nr:NADH-ubiquinone oxidoreductase chain 5 [Trachymyrmex cornetzi]
MIMLYRVIYIENEVNIDGLGIVSYCLVIYYHNYNSYNSGIVTVLCNRIGDVGMLMVIRIIIIIAAPTPVSALVHSSTLVTAGVYLIIRFNEFLITTNIRFVLRFLSILIMLISGVIANFENDFKKIIALSTLRQLGIIIIILRLGFRLLAYYHLLIHAIFKSMLFIGAGRIIHVIKNTQDIRSLGNLNERLPYVIIRLMISNFALRGVPFISGFYRKDLIIEVFYVHKGVNIFIFVLVVISLLLTVSYSIRLFYYLFFNRRIKFYRYIYIYIKERGLINVSMIIMIFIRIILGSLIG